MYKLDTLAVHRGITGSLSGSATISTSASFSTTSSYTSEFGGYINFPNGLVVTGSITASRVSASMAITASNIKLNDISFAPNTNKFLVVDDITNKIHTTQSFTAPTASLALGLNASTATASIMGVGDLRFFSIPQTIPQPNKLLVISTTTGRIFTTESISGFPYSGSADITGSLTVSGSGLTASNAQFTNLIDTTSPNKILVLNTGTNEIFTTASVGTGGGGGTGAGFPYSGSAVITGSLLISGSAGLVVTGSTDLNGTKIKTLTMDTSGSITATAGTTVNLNLTNANVFIVSATGTGTVTWTVTGTTTSGNVQTFVIEYTNGGSVTNSWFTNTRWPAGVAPTLTAAGVDLLSFTTDDAGANWRGVLLQRASQ